MKPKIRPSDESRQRSRARRGILVLAALAERPIVTKVCAAFDMDRVSAVGLLVLFWCAVAKHAHDRHVADVPDEQLERWARWHGDRGAFAAWVRAELVDSGGRIVCGEEWRPWVRR